MILCQLNDTNNKTLNTYLIKMKKIAILIAGIAAPVAMSAAVLRVNNVAGTGAEYTTFEAAHDASKDGDVIIVDGTDTSYGKITISKKITVQGPGYFLDVNDVTKEGYSPASFSEVDIVCDGAKITGLHVDGDIKMSADNLVVTRCYAHWIKLCEAYSYTQDHISNGIIHQNYVLYGICGDSYSASATEMQVTNNIIANGYNVQFANMSHSVISRNTSISSESGVRQLTNCVIENNICNYIENDYWENKYNTYTNNYDLSSYDTRDVYGTGAVTDAAVKTGDAKIAADAGAFSGTDPYVLSGLSTGPVLKDVIIPESVAQGEDLKVTIVIGTSR